MDLPKQVSLVEVSPRDGLQHESQFVTTDHKAAFVALLGMAGLSRIEASSFVSVKQIPQLKDAVDLFAALQRQPGVTYSALVPNLAGFAAAQTAAADEIAVFGAVSESFSQQNIHCSVTESLERFAPVIIAAKQAHIPVRGYISCTLHCPYEGQIPTEKAARYAEKLYQLGCYEIALGDTTGAGTPQQVIELIECVAQQIPREHIAMHFHDTYGQAIANIYASLQQGINTFDCSVSGLGGCPYAKSATGNVATEDVLYLLNGLGIKTGIEMQALIKASDYIDKILSRTTQSRVKLALST